MGAYSELDIEMNCENDPFEEDESWEDETQEETGDAVEEEREEPVSVPQEQPAPVQAEEHPSAKPETTASDEDAKRKAHEEAEAKRKAEFDARQAAKRAAEQEQLDKLAAMSDEEVLAASMKRVGDDTEKLTRRQMMECVMEHIQTLCLSDLSFARKVMHPRKSMIRCAQFINRKAWEYVQDELKARNITPSRTDPYASAIPEGICYQWAVDYFNDPDAKEDHEEEEKFEPKPYYGSASRSKASKSKTVDKKSEKAKKAAAKEAAKKPAAPAGQISLGGFLMPEEKAG